MKNILTNKRVTIPFGKTLFWLIFNIIFGLLPLGIILFFKFFVPGINYSFDQVIEQGVLIFLCVAITTSVLIDYVFYSKRFPKYIDFFIYGTPFFIAATSSLIFSQLFFHNLTDLKINKLIMVQYGIIILSILYSCVIKMIIFKSNSIKNYK